MQIINTVYMTSDEVYELYLKFKKMEETPIGELLGKSTVVDTFWCDSPPYMENMVRFTINQDKLHKRKSNV